MRRLFPMMAGKPLCEFVIMECFQPQKIALNGTDFPGSLSPRGFGPAADAGFQGFRAGVKIKANISQNSSGAKVWPMK
jgi:hypothetical protein